ncbi:DUF6660 family protein [Flavobacterium nackdongense]|uniref:DUF2946 domain-containing protein n=1 Tax=Flavobacterium nackdongense TaxID=2547394 RepID=A0A4P6Y834_9FLAO|nr:DUF6660 family protein [Flavobacterium nackdongense]QBN17908.1 hypothetical protein E1750_03520 [Flavobacterium nackdongense]
MKIFTFILSLYLMALSCLPCADVEVNSLAHSASTVAANHENHSDQNSFDLCAPFCVCNCCGQHILNYNQEITFEFRKIPTEITTQIPTYKSILASNFFGSIWQPPQIA